MTILSIYVDDESMRRLEQYSRESGRTVIDLAESAVGDAASQVRMPPEPTRASTAKASK